jgi:hypothetical protein
MSKTFNTPIYLIFNVLFFCFWLNPASAQEQEPDRDKIYGRLYSAADSLFIGYAHIINSNTNRGSISNDYGNFYISAAPTDTLKFRTVSFKDTSIVVANLPITSKGGVVLFLEPDIIQLKTVEIFPFTPQELLREALALEPLPYKPKDDFKMGYYSDLSQAPSSGAFGLAINGPITALYNAFSKRGRELSKYYALLERDADMEMRNERYNAALVYKVTGMTDEREIAEFMSRCPMSDYFLTYALDYDIVVAIIDCYKDYQRGIR